LIEIKILNKYRKGKKYMAMFGSTNKKDSLFSNMDFEISSDLRMDMTEDDNYYYLYIEIPGRKNEDIKMKFKGDKLSIRVIEEKDNENPLVDKGVIISERIHDEVERLIAFDCPVDRKKVEAKFKDGLLTVTITKIDPDAEDEEDLINIL
jgi:heat shock protein hsp20